jgi:hypothetical protein
MRSCRAIGMLSRLLLTALILAVSSLATSTFPTRHGTPCTTCLFESSEDNEGLPKLVPVIAESEQIIFLMQGGSRSEGKGESR